MFDKRLLGKLRLAIVAIYLSVFAITSHGAEPTNDLVVTLLGTGSPVPSPSRFSQSILIEAGDQKILIDLGRGVTIRLGQLGIPLRDIDASFITHLHSDHIVGLPDFWLTGWLPTPFASRKSPMELYGPKGTEAMAKNLTKAFSEDIRIRELDERLPASGVAIDAHNIDAGPVYQKDGLKVVAFATDHGPLIKPTFGYTITYKGRKVVIPSDTVYDPRIAKKAHGADLLIHEVALIDPALMKKYPRFRQIIDHHTAPEDAGRIFAKAKPRLAVFTHIIVLKKGGGLNLPADKIVSRTRKTYEGPLVVGQDLMSFDVGSSITVRNANGKLVKTIAATK